MLIEDILSIENYNFKHEFTHVLRNTKQEEFKDDFESYVPI